MTGKLRTKGFRALDKDGNKITTVAAPVLSIALDYLLTHLSTEDDKRWHEGGRQVQEVKLKNGGSEWTHYSRPRFI